MGAQLFSVYTNVTQNIFPPHNKYYFLMYSEVYSCIVLFFSSKLLYVVYNRTKLLLCGITVTCHKRDMKHATPLPRWWLRCTQVTHATVLSLECYMVHFMVDTSRLLFRSSMHKTVTICFINYNTKVPKQEPLSLEPTKKRQQQKAKK